MTSGIIFKQGNIILMPFPYSDLSNSKKRPALILSSNSFNNFFSDIICCLITTNPKKELHSINITDNDVIEGKLHFKSKVKPFRLFTVDKKIVLKKLCKLKKNKFNSVIQNLQRIIPKQA
ncbi:MAG: type II toxin-antitoxin system PemK/MazF family toxin [archaeon]